MARISYSFKETGIDAISKAGRTRLGRVQSSDVGANLPNTPVQELGSDRIAGRIFDLPEITVSVSTFDVGARTAFTLAGVDWAAAASGTYIEAQQIQYVCLAQTFKGEGTSEDIARTLYIPGAKLDSLSMNYSVGGDATEDYSFQATTTRWLKYDVAVASGVTAGGSFTLPSNGRVLKNGRHVLSVFGPNGYLPDEVVTGTTASSVTFDTTKVPDGTAVLVTYHRDLTDQWDYTYEYPNIANGYTPAPDQPVGVRGWGVEVYLVKSGQADSRVYRAQSCTIQSQLQTTRVQELGSETVVGYSDGIPDVTGTLEVMQHDFKLHELLSGDLTSAEDNYDPNELGTGDFGLLIKVWRRGADRLTTSPEKTVWVPSIDITQESNRAQVGQDVMQTFNWTSRKGDVYIYKGNKPA